MRQRSIHLAAVICFLFAGTQSWAQADATATVAAWNIEDGTSDDSRIDTIADGVVWLDAEIILLTEASNENRMELLVTRLADRGATYTLHMEEQGRDRDHIAILAKDDVTVSDVALIAPARMASPAMTVNAPSTRTPQAKFSSSVTT